MTNFCTKFLIVFLFFNYCDCYWQQTCYCSYIPDVVFYCSSSWISQVKVLNKSISHLDNNSLDFFDSGDKIKYSVQHINVLKNDNNESTLPNFIITPQKFSDCGLSWLKEGEDYILAGSRSSDDALCITLCDGLKFNENRGETIAKINLWKKIIPCPTNTNDK